MRKIFLIILAAAMAFVTACSDSEGSGADSTLTISSDTSQGDDSSAYGDKSASANTSSDPISELSEEQSSTEPKPISTNESTNYTNTSADTPSSTAAQSSSSASSLTSSTSSTSSSSESSSNTSSTVNSSTTIKLPESSSSASSSGQSSEPPNKEENDLNITITVNGRAFSATLYDNETARAFKERLPLTLDMSELNGNEKYYYLPESLPTNSSRPSVINAGDIMLYGGDCLVIFYESFSTSYSYTPIGKIEDPDGLAAALGSGSVRVAFD